MKSLKLPWIALSPLVPRKERESGFQPAKDRPGACPTFQNPCLSVSIRG